jgi:hypothetical protein
MMYVIVFEDGSYNEDREINGVTCHGWETDELSEAAKYKTREEAELVSEELMGVGEIKQLLE